MVTEQLALVEKAAKDLLGGTKASEITTSYKTTEWTTHHWNHFLRSLGEKLPADRMQDLDAEFKFTQSGNSEITHDWLMLAIGSEYQPAMDRLEEFLTEQGRRKFLAPLYTKLSKTEKGLKHGKAIYAKARPGYHSVSTGTIDEILGWEK